MTAFPYSIEAGASLTDAKVMMAEHDIRHLPVTDGGQIVGIVAYTDVLAALTVRDEGSDETRVAEVCATHAYVVEVGTHLEDVTREMARRHIGSALVTKQGKLVGILTGSDVCRVLGDLLESLRPGAPGSGGDVA